MDSAIELLFNYLNNAIYDPDNASLVIEDLPEELREFGNGLKYYTECVMETTALASALSKGVLDGALPDRGNEIAAPLKSLHASLRHLTWQAKRIADGDYNQSVSFMGEFSDAFNLMVEQLTERERNLEEKIRQIEEKTAALEQGNLLLTSLIHYIPQQIFVIDRSSRNVLLTNDIALSEINQNADYLESITRLISDFEDLNSGLETVIEYKHGGETRFFLISRFYLEWQSKDAEVYVINDVSETHREIASLETRAYRDGMTDLFNRAYGMKTLNLWLHEKKQFALVFIDLDSLKYVNDAFGHTEGDIYITRAGDHLRSFSPDAVVCRIGGDEFMLLAPGFNFDDAFLRMSEIAHNLRYDDYTKDKKYTYNMSFGIATVDKDNRISADGILGAADYRMYEDKHRNKIRYKQARYIASL